MLLYLACATTNVESTQQICYMESTKHSLVGTLHISLHADIKQCKQECLTLDTSQCSSVIYIISRNLCLLVSGHEIEGDGFYDQNTVHFRRICRSRAKMQATLLKKACFEEFRGKVLLGVVDELFEKVSQAQCRKACAASLKESNVLCKAAIYYPREQECIISSQNRFDLPELFTEDISAVYLENRCANDSLMNRTWSKVDNEEAKSSFTDPDSTSPLMQEEKEALQQPLKNIEVSGYGVDFKETLLPPHPEYNVSEVYQREIFDFAVGPI
uniref:Apple domain-containing protein n=1 Tax=Setaria digitata TaxID=48799 RepID=A0A915PUH0_9BILA